MASCIYCGAAAGFLCWWHRECRKRHVTGRNHIVALLAAAPWSPEEAEKIKERVTVVAIESFISPNKIRKLAVSGWSNAVDQCLDAEGINLATKTKLASLQNAFGLSQEELNRAVAPGIIEQDTEGARALLAALDQQGVSLNEVTEELVKEGVQQFADAFDKLFGAIARRRHTLIEGDRVP